MNVLAAAAAAEAASASAAAAAAAAVLVLAAAALEPMCRSLLIVCPVNVSVAAASAAAATQAAQDPAASIPEAFRSNPPASITAPTVPQPQPATRPSRTLILPERFRL